MDNCIRKITRELSLPVVLVAALVLAVGMPGQAAGAEGNFSGVKYDDRNQNGVQDGLEPGLIGWTIYVFNTGTLALVQTAVTLPADPGALPPTPDGFYRFNLDPGMYTVCEEQRAGWTQTTPLPGSVPPSVGETLGTCAPFEIPNGLILAPRGYNFTTLTTEVFSKNDFGNFQVVSPVVPLTDFRDVRRTNGITIGPDLGGTGQEALNFTGTARAGGDTWITVYDPAPNPPPVTFGSVSLSADVLIHAYNNKKGAGLLALYNEPSGKKGLALTLYNAGNTDSLVLATVDQAGKLVTLKTVSLGAAIAKNVWYRVSMDVTVEAGLVSVVGTVFRHETPTDPNSALRTQVGVPLTFSATLGGGALVGVQATGEVGVLSAAVGAANSSSVTNITIHGSVVAPSCPEEEFIEDPNDLTQLYLLYNPQPATMCVTGATHDGFLVTVQGNNLTALGKITAEYYDNVNLGNHFVDLDLATSPCVSDVSSTAITVDLDCATAHVQQPLVQDVRFRPDPVNDPWAVTGLVGFYPYMVPFH